MIKKVIAILTFVLVVCTIAGCTSTNTPNNTTPSPTVTHDALLEKLVNATKQEVYGNASYKVQEWGVTWNNGTSVAIAGTVELTSTGTPVIIKSTLTSFPTTQDATNYLNAFDKTNYSSASANYASDTSHVYSNATGHTPTVYKEYSYTEGSLLGGSVKLHELTQYDNIIQMGTATATL